MKSITGNIDKNTYDYLSQYLNRFGFVVSPFGSYWKQPNDYNSFEKWYQNHKENISINSTDMLFIDMMSDEDKMVIIGEIPETEDGDLIEYRDNFLFIKELDLHTLIQIKDFLNG
jgi:hypothetical protein